MLQQSHMQQCKPQEGKSQQRSKAHIVGTHFKREDNPKLIKRQLLTTNEKEEEEWRHDTAFQTKFLKAS